MFNRGRGDQRELDNVSFWNIISLCQTVYDVISEVPSGHRGISAWRHRCGVLTPTPIWVLIPPPANSLTPAGCPTVHLNSDSVYWEVASDAP